MAAAPPNSIRMAGMLAMGFACLIPGLAGVAHAQAAGQPGWRIVKLIGPPSNRTMLNQVVATSARDAWAVGGWCPTAGCTEGEVAIEHWNGRAWHQIAPPRGLPADDAAVAVGARSAANAWIFTSGIAPGPGYALHLVNGRFTRFKLAPSAQVTHVADFGPANVWAFGAYYPSQRQYTLRYNGHSWRRVTLPTAADLVSAVSPDDIWASGSKPVKPGSLTRVSVIMHWDGRSWRTIALPRIRPPAGALVGVSIALGVSEHNAWAEYFFAKGGCCIAGGLLHWDGKTWHRVPKPAIITSFGSGNVVSDGHGGLWLEGGNNTGTWMFRYSGGRWHRYDLPTLKGELISDLYFALIPGTRSVWGVSSAFPFTGSEFRSVIVKYGP